MLAREVFVPYHALLATDIHVIGHATESGSAPSSERNIRGIADDGTSRQACDLCEDGCDFRMDPCCPRAWNWEKSAMASFESVTQCEVEVSLTGLLMRSAPVV